MVSPHDLHVILMYDIGFGVEIDNDTKASFLFFINKVFCVFWGMSINTFILLAFAALIV